MEKDGSIKSDHRIDDLEAFEKSLNKIFGFGAKVIEKKILEVLYMKIETPKEIKGDFKFVEEVRSAQKSLDSTDLVTAEAY